MARRSPSVRTSSAGAVAAAVLFAASLHGLSAASANVAHGHPSIIGHAARPVVHTYGWGFPDPSAIVADGTHVWITNKIADSVTELEATTGSFVRVLLPGHNALVLPDTIAAGGGYVWTTGQYCQESRRCDDGVAQFSATTGALVRVLDGLRVGFTGEPMYSIASRGPFVWMMNSTTILKIRSSTGTLVWSTPNSFGGGQLAVDGTHVWIADTYLSGDSVTELLASTGARVRTIKATADRLVNPTSIATDGTHVWVGSQSYVTELAAATGALEQAVPLPSIGLSQPVQSLALGATTVWISDGHDLAGLEASNAQVIRTQPAAATALAVGGGWLWALETQGAVQVNLATGQLTQRLSGSGYQFHSPQAIASDGTHLWVANPQSNSVTELLVSTGALVRVIDDPADDFATPNAVATDGVHVWVTSDGADPPSVTELSTSTGSVERVIDSPADELNPIGVVATGSDVWVVNRYSLTELDATSGSLERIVSTITDPQGAVVTGGHLWVASGDGIVSELDAASGHLLRTSNAKLGYPVAIATDGPRVWVLDARAGTLVEIRASDGRVLATAKLTRYGIVAPQSVAASGGRIWVTSGCAYGECPRAIAEFTAAPFRLDWFLTGTGSGVNDPDGITVVGKAVWVTELNQDSLTSFPSR